MQNSLITSLLAWDKDMFLRAQGLVSPQYAHALQLAGEVVVIYGALLLVGLWLYGVKERDNGYKEIALSLFWTVLLTFSFYAVVNFLIPQWRPGAMELSGAKALIPHPMDNSFPSGHALFTGALLVGLWRYYRRSWALTLLILTALIALVARVVGGVHYPGDIIGGLLFGIVGAMILRPVTELCIRYISPYLIRIASWIKL